MNSSDPYCYLYVQAHHYTRKNPSKIPALTKTHELSPVYIHNTH